MPLSVESALPPPALFSRLRELSALRGRAAAARGTYSTRFAGWDLREQPDGISLRPITWETGRPWEPRFVGTVQASGAGSRISGEVRQHSSARVFSALLIGLGVLLPLLAAVVPVAGQTAQDRASRAREIAAIAAVIAVAGLLLLRLSLRSATRAIQDFLAVAASK